MVISKEGGISMQVTYLNHRDVLDILPDRDPWGHKGTFGKVLLLCGSRGYTGAAYLAAMGALRTGAGLVFLGVPESIYEIEAIKLNEPVVFPLPDEGGKLSSRAIPEISRYIPQMDAILIGCGLGQSDGTFSVVKSVLEQAKCPVVLDADGINVLSMHKDILRGRTYPTILTPHEGEFQRFGGNIGQDRMASAASYSQQWNSILLLKGHRTCITDGRTIYINETGNPGMSVGGSGDILAGMIVSLLGQGLNPLDAAACAAWLHGAAGDLCAEEIGQYGMLPTDMLMRIPRLMK
jgi:NAD(P)H-hydrate epimerase